MARTAPSDDEPRPSERYFLESFDAIRPARFERFHTVRHAREDLEFAPDPDVGDKAWPCSRRCCLTSAAVAEAVAEADALRAQAEHGRPGSMAVHVNTLSGTKHVVKVDPSDTVDMLKLKVQGACGQEWWRQRLFLANATETVQEIEAGTMQENGLTDGARVNVASQLPGLRRVANVHAEDMDPLVLLDSPTVRWLPRGSVNLNVVLDVVGAQDATVLEGAAFNLRKTTVSDVRRVVFDKLRVSHDADELSAIELSFRGTVLYDPQTLAACGIPGGDQRTLRARILDHPQPQPWARVNPMTTVSAPCMCFVHSMEGCRCCCPAWGFAWALGENAIGTCQCTFCCFPLLNTLYRQGDGNVFGRPGLSNVELLLEWSPQFGRATSQLPGWVFLSAGQNAELVYRPSRLPKFPKSGPKGESIADRTPSPSPTSADERRE